jgi:class 3 adenylate cyclase
MPTGATDLTPAQHLAARGEPGVVSVLLARKFSCSLLASPVPSAGSTDPAGPWLSIGVGVHAGKTFVGSIGVEGGNYQFAALGDPMNFCARLVAAAKGDEMIISEAVWSDVSGNISAEPCSLELKGYAEPVKAYVIRVTPL